MPGAQTSAATAQFTAAVGGRSVEVMMVLALDSSTAVSGSLRAVVDGATLAQIDGAMAANSASSGLFNVAVLSATANPPAGNGYGSVAVSTTGAEST